MGPSATKKALELRPALAVPKGKAKEVAVPPKKNFVLATKPKRIVIGAPTELAMLSIDRRRRALNLEMTTIIPSL